jgi:hypothetical protein
MNLFDHLRHLKKYILKLFIFRTMTSLTQLAAILSAVLIGEFPTCLGKSTLFIQGILKAVLYG